MAIFYYLIYISTSLFLWDRVSKPSLRGIRREGTVCERRDLGLLYGRFYDFTTTGLKGQGRELVMNYLTAMGLRIFSDWAEFMTIYGPLHVYTRLNMIPSFY